VLLAQLQKRRDLVRDALQGDTVEEIEQATKVASAGLQDKIGHLRDLVKDKLEAGVHVWLGRF
jgi:hypothetical protein